VIQSEQVQAKASAETLLAKQHELERIFARLRECKTVVDQLTSVSEDAFTVSSGLLTAAEFKQWQEIQADPRWRSPVGALNRLRGTCEAIRKLLDHVPQLDSSTQRTIRLAEDDLARIKLRLHAPVAPAPEPAALDETPVLASLSSEDLPRPLADRGEQLGLDRVYDLVRAVAAVKYCSGMGNRGSNPKRFLEILELLGYITFEEAKQLRGPLEELINRRSVEVRAGQKQADVWRSTKPNKAHWVTYSQKVGRRSRPIQFWRLVQSCEQEGVRLLQTFGYTRAQVEAAFKRMSENKDARFQARLQQAKMNE
jgi:hypothetical protein